MAKLEADFLESRFEQINFISSLNDLLKQVKKQQNFNNILMVNGGNAATPLNSCWLLEVLEKIQLPIILLSTYNLVILRSSSPSTDVVIMSCHYMEYNNEYWFNKNYQLAPHIILADNAQEIINICESLMKTEIYNAAIILKEFALTKVFHSCKFKSKMGSQIAEVVRNVFHENILIYQDSYLQNSEISTLPDQMYTRSFVYHNSKGEIKMDGYLGNILESFARRVKATLVYKYPLQPGVVTYPELIENRTLEGNLDVAASIKLVRNNISNLSYPVEFSDYCYMMPLPKYISTNKLFFIIVDIKATLVILSLMYIYGILITLAIYGSKKYLTFINVFLNDKSIRGLLGQSYVIPGKPRFLLRYICLLIGCSSVLINTTYQAYLQSYLTEPPSEQMIRSYDDLRQTGIHIMTSNRIIKYLKPSVLENYRDVFVFCDTYEQYVKKREQMNTSFGYPLTRPLWNVYNEKQKFFKQPMFFYTSSLCIVNLSLVAIPVRPGWPYRELFSRHIMQLQDNGLMHLWTRTSFFMMLRFGQTNLDDLSPDSIKKKEITLNDLFWIWLLYLISICISMIAFVGELIVMRLLKKK